MTSIFIEPCFGDRVKGLNLGVISYGGGMWSSQ